MIYSVAHVLADNLDLEPGRTRSPFKRRLKSARKPLHLALNGRNMAFKSIDDFSFAIECRIGVTSVRYHLLFERSAQELRTESKNIKAVEKTIVDILEDALCDGSPCGAALEALSLQVFSNDHDWRKLMEQLVALDDRYDAYKRLALIKYMQYLGARQEVIRLIFATKNKRKAATVPAGDPGSSNPAMMETMLFDMSAENAPGATSDGLLQRLPQGEAIKLYALPGHAIDIKLAKHPFRLLNDNGWVLCEPDGTRHTLGDAKMMIGRGRENDIRLDARFGYISRRHLIAEPLDDHVILITDLSSHGTFAPAMQAEKIAV